MYAPRRASSSWNRGITADTNECKWKCKFFNCTGPDRFPFVQILVSDFLPCAMWTYQKLTCPVRSGAALVIQNDCSGLDPHTRTPTSALPTGATNTCRWGSQSKTGFGQQLVLAFNNRAITVPGRSCPSPLEVNIAPIVSFITSINFIYHQ